VLTQSASYYPTEKMIFFQNIEAASFDPSKVDVRLKYNIYIYIYTNSVSNSHRRNPVSVIKTSRLMLFPEIIGVY
jgi:hypothetical protein